MNNEENTLTIEAYISWKNKRFALKDFIKEALKEIEDYQKIINKAIELLEDDYFEDGSGNNIDKVLDILRGKDYVKD